MARQIFRSLARMTRLLALVAGALGLASNAGQAQNAFDKGTPAESKGGLSSLSTYAQDKIETVNLANGNLNVHLPLVTVGGRGPASFTISLNYNSKVWTGQHNVEIEPEPIGQPPGKLHHYTATFADAVGRTPNAINLGAGWQISRGPAIKTHHVLTDLVNPAECPGIQGDHYRYGLTKVTLRLPDGSEIQLRDERTDGAPFKFPNACMPQGTDGYRGRVWRSVDGSSVTYVTDVDNGAVTGDLSGYVFLADGTRLRMVGADVGGTARCTKIIDPNGNWLRINYNAPTSGAVTYTDQLGRDVILQGVTGGATVTITGYNGTADRVLTVITGAVAPFDNVSAAPNLRADYQDTTVWPRPFISGDLAITFEAGTQLHRDYGGTPHTDLISDLSQEINSDVDAGVTEMSLVTTVTRLDLLDGRKFTFRYNPWGELAEIVYPGGGVSQIDYGAIGSRRCEMNVLRPMLNRGVTSRRVYNNGAGSGVQADAIWTYTRDVFATPYPWINVDVQTLQQTGTYTGSMSEKHYFLALDVEYFYPTTGDFCSGGTHNEKFENAKEIKVERQTGSGMQVETLTWAQRAAQNWLAAPDQEFREFVGAHFQEQGPNDDRMTREDTTLENGKVKRVQHTYDQYNNLTSTEEYGFGSGAPGALLRQTTRTYLSSQNGYCYTNLNGLDGSCGSGLFGIPDDAIHRRRLLLTETITNSSGSVEAYTEGYIDRAGNMVVEPRFDEARVFSFGFAHVRLGTEWYYIDSGGHQSPIRFGGAPDFAEGLTPAAGADNVGYVDSRLNWSITPQFADGGRFSDGIAPVQVREKWGYINRRGIFVIPPRFVKAQSFSEGVAAVADDVHREGYIDKSGRFVIPPRFRDADAFSEGLAPVIYRGHFVRSAKEHTGLEFVGARLGIHQQIWKSSNQVGPAY